MNIGIGLIVVGLSK